MHVSYTPYLRKAAAKARHGTLYIRVTVERKHIYLNTFEEIPVSAWLPRHKRVSLSYPNGAALNDLLALESAKAHGAVLQMKLGGQAVNYTNVLAALRPDAPSVKHMGFTELVNAYCEWAAVGPQRLKQYGTTISLWKREKLPANVNDTTEKMFAAMRVKLAKDGMAYNTIISHYKRFKAVMAWALERHYISRNPVAKIRLGDWQSNKGFLSETDIAAIEKSLDKLHAEKQNIARLFLLMCYTGIRFSDCINLDAQRLVHTPNGPALVYVQQKTKQQEMLPLLPQAVALLPHVYGLHYTNQYFNRELKSVGDAAGLSVKISAHMARHTFATLALNKGIRLEVVQTLLGHANIKTTMGYAKLNARTKFVELQKMNTSGAGAGMEALAI